MKIVSVFCANEQKKTDHKVAYINGEYVYTCDCGRFLKLPGDLKEDEINEAKKAHEESNKGQVTKEAVDKEAEEKLKIA